MRRETTNRIRYVIEEFLPPILRDSFVFRVLADLAIGGQATKFSEFRKSAPFLSSADYESLYRSYTHVHDGGDNTLAALDRIARDTIGTELCDIGCGGGALLRYVRRQRPEIKLTGVDIVVGEELRRDKDLTILETSLENLPFPDSSFDTVVCTHVLEHVLDIRRALSELRRITRQRMIIVVPQEREALYTFNPHFHFFPYKETFERLASTARYPHTCEYISRDIYYCETHVNAASLS